MALQQQLKGDLKLNQSLAKYTSWRVGGEAKQIYRPADKYDLANFLQDLPDNEPLLWIGLGSNLLIRDGGFNGTVIVTAGSLQTIQVKENTVEAEVGSYSSKFAKTVAKAGLSGAAFWAGIPGTIGGSLAMNAGAHGAETWDYVIEVTTVNRRGELKTYPANAFKVEYRHVALPEGEWFVAAKMKFETGDVEKEQLLIRELLKKRNASQPTNQPCAGSVFRNPEGDYSGRLVEVTGLKGLTLGGASVSTKHANFIVNDGNATAADIENLIYLVQEKVQQAQGVKLVPEVHIVGEHV